MGHHQDYHRCVIALCTTTAANTGSSSHCSGTIYRHRDNGLVPLSTAIFSFNGAYGAAYGAGYSLFSDHENFSTEAITGEGYRACTFIYNGTHLVLYTREIKS